MVPDGVTVAAMAGELEAARAWAERQGVQLDCDLPSKLVRAVLIQQDSGHHFFLQGQFDGYKAIPPVWQWCDSSWSEPGKHRWSPEPAETPYGSSMFISTGGTAVICAPFNRLAYRVQGGPHGDWGELIHWMTAGQGYVRSVTIADMLHSIQRDFGYTKGRMG